MSYKALIKKSGPRAPVFSAAPADDIVRTAASKAGANLAGLLLCLDRVVRPYSSLHDQTPKEFAERFLVAEAKPISDLISEQVSRQLTSYASER